MKKKDVLFLLLAVITVIFIGAIGIAIAYRSVLFAALSIVGATISMGTGFYFKKRFRELNS